MNKCECMDCRTGGIQVETFAGSGDYRPHRPKEVGSSGMTDDNNNHECSFCGRIIPLGEYFILVQEEE